ncbi:MAG: CHASE domain-containing protein, partial [Gammaproteobacteria bacterium]|nr:CHASE domain-containing protein [Gammaproteobacteria bacterium]
MLKKYSLIIAILSFGFGFSIILNKYLIIKHNLDDKLKFEELSEQRFISFNRALNESQSFMRNLSHFFEGRTKISSDEFKLLTQPLLETNLAINSIAWIPKVSRYNTEEWSAPVYEKAFEYFSPFDETEKFKDNSLDEYIYPKIFVVPELENKSAFGKNIADNKNLYKTMHRAEETKQQVTSHAFHLDDDIHKPLVVNIFTPVYHKTSFHPNFNKLE